MSGKFVNKLAAFPSMHFGYAFCIGCVFIADSGVLTGLINKAFNYVFRSSDPDADAEEDDEDLLLKRRSPLVRGLMFAFGLSTRAGSCLLLWAPPTITSWMLWLPS